MSRFYEYRIALVTGATKEVAEAYLPSNYAVVGALPDDSGSLLIAGIDAAGWTLDDYIKPRVSSGMIGCRELTGHGL